MLGKFFLQILNMSLTAGVMILAAVFLLGNPGHAPQDDQVQDIEIFYHADDGEFDRSIHWGTGPLKRSWYSSTR